MNKKGIPLARTGQRAKLYFGEEVFDPGSDPPNHWTTKKRDSFKWSNVRVIALDDSPDQVAGGYTIGIGELGLAGLRDHTDHYKVIENLRDANEVCEALRQELHPKARWLADRVREDIAKWEEQVKTM